MKNHEPLLICISGPSGVGKGTVIQRLKEAEPGLRFSVSTTTRAPRGQEVDGTHYHFRSRETFEKMLANDEILEYDCYCGNYYGTAVHELKLAAEAGEDLILDITIAGTVKLKSLFPNAIMVFLMPPTLGDLRRRLEGRETETQEAIEKRLAQAIKEIECAKDFHYIVINDRIEDAVHRLAAILTAERCRYSRMSGIEKEIMQEN